MKKVLSIFVLVLIFGVSCSSSYSYETEPVYPVVKSYYPIEDDFDYDSLVSEPFSRDYYISKKIALPPRVIEDDEPKSLPLGEVNPYRSKSFVVYDNTYYYLNESYHGDTDFYKTFDLSKVSIINSFSTSRNAFYFVDVEKIEESYKVRFYLNYLDARDRFFAKNIIYLDAIESNGIYSYYFPLEPKRSNKTNNILYSLHSDDTLQYTVYLGQKGIYLISKNPKFDVASLNLESISDLILFKA